MPPTKDQTLTILRQFRATQDEVYAEYRRSLLELEQEEERLLSELRIVRERKAQVHRSLEQGPQVRRCLSQHNIRPSEERCHRYRSNYALEKVPDAEIAQLSSEELQKHINKVAVAHSLAKQDGAKQLVVDNLWDNLSRLRLEKKTRKKLNVV